MLFQIDANKCVACSACLRACPVEAIGVEGTTVQVVQEACLKCGRCVPACQHDAVGLQGDLALATELAARGEAILILGVEAEVHFPPAPPRAAAVDKLTGLATYRVLRDRLRQEVARARRTRELFADMDQFKAVNDRYGHKAGNDVLELVAGVMAKTVRTTDVAARFGGDEFVVLRIGADAQGADKVGEEVRQSVETVGKDAGYPAGMVTVSGGVAHFSGDGGSDDVLDAADQAQYLAKSAGGNRVVIAA